VISGADPVLAAAAVSLTAAAGWLMSHGSGPASRRLLRGADTPTWRAWAGRLRRARGVPAAAGVALVAALATAAAFALVPAAVAAFSSVVVVRRFRAARRAREARRQRGEDVTALRALAAELRGGLPPASALRVAAKSPAPARGIRRRMLAAAAADSLGGDPAEVLARDAVPGSPAASLAAAWSVCRRTGTRLSAPVSRIANGAAADLRVAREADAALASARSSARLLAVLPFAGAGLGALSGAGTIRVLMSTGIGQLCLVLGVALDLAGLAWLDRLAGSAGA
jgi:tight adherence protein B